MKKTIAIMTMLAMVAMLASSAQAAVITVDPTTPLSTYVSDAEWNGTSDEDWIWYNDVQSRSVSGGVYTITLQTGAAYGNDPFIGARNGGPPGHVLSYDTNTYKYVEFRLKIPTGATDTMQVMFYVNSGNRFYSLPTGHDDGEFHVYQMDMTNDANWQQNVYQLRFDFGGADSEGETFELDYFRLSATPEPATMTLLLLGLPLALRRRRK